MLNQQAEGQITFQVKAQRLGTEAWSSFGWIPAHITDPEDGRARLVFESGDPHVNIVSNRLDRVTQTSTGLICRAMNRHQAHNQTLLVLNCPAVVAVAPASSSLSGPEDLDEVRAFLLEPLDSFVLHRGTWHWGPYPVGSPQVDLFNIQALRWADDDDSVKLTERGMAFEVTVGG
ncbi:MAG TPA: ureidoglycolate lyase [Acidimicrobiales bacterium]|nr:ureidoglycolate lyase [Acidimicrobiales bacterium]